MNVTHQTTVGRACSLKGIGLHTGNMSTITFKPAPANSGIVFVRTDLADRPRIPAVLSSVNAVAVRGTSIGDERARVYTIEHLLAACSALGIDNAEIEIDNNEPPVMDGSATPFARMLGEAGIAALDEPREYITLGSAVHYSAGATKFSAYPAEEFSISCMVNYDHPFLKEQSLTLTITPQNFLNDIAPARTFCFDYEIEALRAKGLAKGGDFSNAIVIGISGIHNTDDPLRYPDEFARHKMLDLIGDLYLLGHPIKARVTAERPGHNNNIAFARELEKALVLQNT